MSKAYEFLRGIHSGDADAMIQDAAEMVILCMEQLEISTAKHAVKGHGSIFLRREAFEASNSYERWTDYERKFVGENVEKMEVTELAKAMGRSVGSIRMEASKQGKKPKRSRSLDDWQKNEIGKLAGTAAARIIAEKVGCHINTLYRYLKSNDLPVLTKYKPWSEEKNAKVIASFKQGKRVPQLAVEFDCSEDSIRAKLYRLGVEVKNDRK